LENARGLRVFWREEESGSMAIHQDQGGSGQQAERQAEVSQRVEDRKTARLKRAEEVRQKYDFGVIRALRQQRSLTIEQFAKLCGLSYAPISRIETNLIKPNLETLDKIAAGLGISTYNLVAMAERREAQTQSAREYRAGGFAFQLVSFEEIEIYFGEGERGAVAENPDVHSKDVLEVRVNEKVFTLSRGEAVSFDCVFPHKYCALEDVEFVVVSHSRR
jgi:transcriptional regulator with XRE-family HTH domain